MFMVGWLVGFYYPSVTLHYSVASASSSSWKQEVLAFIHTPPSHMTRRAQTEEIVGDHTVSIHKYVNNTN